MQPQEQKEDTHKSAKCWGYGIASAGVAAGGAALMVLGGPIGLLAGGIILGTGISREVNVVQQAISDKEDFSEKSLLISAGIGAAGGAIAAPFSIAGGAIAGTVASTGGRVAVQAGAAALGGAASGMGTQVIQNCTKEEKTWHDSIFRSALFGLGAGAIGGGLG